MNLSFPREGKNFPLKIHAREERYASKGESEKKKPDVRFLSRGFLSFFLSFSLSLSRAYILKSVRTEESLFGREKMMMMMRFIHLKKKKKNWKDARAFE